MSEGSPTERALDFAGDLWGVHKETVRRWIDEFKSNDCEFALSLRGLHPKTHWLLEDEEKQMQAKEFVRTNSKKMSIEIFTNWVNEPNPN